MEIVKQQWFWVGIFSIVSAMVGALASILTGFITENSKRKTEIKLQTLKMYDEKKFQAHIDLFNFIYKAYDSFDVEDDNTEDFIILMRKYFPNLVKTNYPFYSSIIREKVKILDGEYLCIKNPQIFSSEWKNDFNKGYLNALNDLNKMVESTFDKWESK
jgi:hypothetical protein